MYTKIKIGCYLVFLLVEIVTAFTFGNGGPCTPPVYLLLGALFIMISCCWTIADWMYMLITQKRLMVGLHIIGIMSQAFTISIINTLF